MDGPRTSSLLEGSISNYFGDMMDEPKVEKIEAKKNIILPIHTVVLDKNACVLTEIVFNSQSLIFIGTYFNVVSAYSIVREGKDI